MIILENISKHYQKEGSQIVHKVLNDITFTINQDDSIAIVGPSGCGKSTLLNMIGTLDFPTAGMVKYDGVDISKLNDKQLSELRNQRIGFVFQMHHLLPQLRVIENVILPVLPYASKQELKKSTQKAEELLIQVGLKDHINQFPGQLSGGECQRVAVVRALINKPDIILADEPTGSLDQKSAEQIGNLLVEIQQERGIAIIVVTHSKQLADKMKTKFSLINGKLEQYKQ